MWLSDIYSPRITEGRRLKPAEETTQTAEHGLSDYPNIEDKEFNRILQDWKKVKKRKKILKDNVLQEHDPITVKKGDAEKTYK